jgi:hypothetical protein
MTEEAQGKSKVDPVARQGYEVPVYLYLALAMFTLPVFTILKPWPPAYSYHPRLRRQQDQERKELYGSDGITRLG